MKRLADGLLRWTGPHPEWSAGDFGAEVASFAVRAGGEGLLIDPLLIDPLLSSDDSFLDELFEGAERVSILVTIGYHARSSEELASRFDARIYGPANVAKRLGDLDRFVPIEPGDELPGGARSFAIGKPRRGEQPLYLPSHRALVFGDAVVEHGGQLRVWVHDPVDDRVRRFYRERFNPTLRPLLELDVERVLVTHGEPVLAGGRAALRRALDADPWYHHG